MPALKLTDFSAEITWIGHVPDREATLRSTSSSEAFASFAGIEGEDHGGLTRGSCVRVRDLHPVGTDIRNSRQLAVLSAEELEAIAAEMGLDELNPAWVGASLVIRGIPDFTHVPPNSRLQGPDGVTLTIDMENRPCVLPAPVIEEDAPGFGKLFKPAAKGRRGVTAWVEREGMLRVGDTMRLAIPDQPAWPHLEIARN